MKKDCLQCGNKIPARNTYCNVVCQKQYQYETYISRWLNNEECGYKGKTLQLSSYVRRYIKETRGTACEVCGWDEKHPIDGKSVTEIDHIDGDASNNHISNLKVLCPNHHALTSTYRARNKNSSRERK